LATLVVLSCDSPSVLSVASFARSTYWVMRTGAISGAPFDFAGVIDAESAVIPYRLLIGDLDVTKIVAVRKYQAFGIPKGHGPATRRARLVGPWVLELDRGGVSQWRRLQPRRTKGCGVDGAAPPNEYSEREHFTQVVTFR
jgi:hypothetical protein